jgi:hypothetical protein
VYLLSALEYIAEDEDNGVSSCRVYYYYYFHLFLKAHHFFRVAVDKENILANYGWVLYAL